MPGTLQAALLDQSRDQYASVASIWEIAIKTRLHKLDPRLPLAYLPRYLSASGLKVLPITAQHAVTEADPPPTTRDPFDRLLLAQCAVEGLRLLTIDRMLTGHPFAWRPS